MSAGLFAAGGWAKAHGYKVDKGGRVQLTQLEVIGFAACVFDSLGLNMASLFRDMILCLGTTPAAQRVMVFQKLALDAVNRTAIALDTACGKSVNVAKVLKALGEHPVALGFLGGDRGAFIETQLDAKGVEHGFIPVAAPTRQCLTIVDESAGTHTELVEEGHRAPLSDYQKLEMMVQRRVGDCRALVLSGSLTPDGPQDFYFRCAQLARAAGVLSVVDAQGAPLANALRAGPGLVKPNRQELVATMGQELKDDAAVMSAMWELRERGAQRVVVTAGKQTTLAFDGRRYWRITPPTIEAKNPIGSGDAFTAGLVWRLLKGDDLGEACRWASAAGAANALTLLPGEVERADVERLAKKVKAERI